MCGFIIAASFGQPVCRRTFEAARDSMVHRGPDASGAEYFLSDRVALGHRRLSIIDLSARGNQPMQLDSLWIVFNGEIYNYPALKSELQKMGRVFRTDSDTEVILHGYAVWGKQVCSRLDGMFAFAIWDRENREFFLARDHVGQKPLYYACNNELFVAASEIKGIRHLLGRGFEMRCESVLDHLIYSFVPEPYTWYKNVFCIQAGHQMHMRLPQCQPEIIETPYWTFTPPVQPAAISTEEAREQMGSEIRSAIESHLIADVEVGALLSGGVDSGSIVAVASELSAKPLQTFSLGFGSRDGDELPLAREVAETCGTKHRETILGESEFQTSVADLLETFDQPFADPSLLPTRKVAELASKHVKVVLTGDGGDEVFGGYNLGTYINPSLDRDVWRKFTWNSYGFNQVRSHISDRLQYVRVGQDGWNRREHYPRYKKSATRHKRILSLELREQLEQYDHKWLYPPNQIEGLDAFRQAQWHHIKFILPGKMLAKVDRSTMQYSLEARSPFLCHRLIETMLSMPTEIKNPTSDWYKGLLRQWAAEKLPRSVLWAPKRGFAPPAEWQPRDENNNHGIRMIENCLSARLISPDAWPELRRKPKLLWKVLQIEEALAAGMFDAA